MFSAIEYSAFLNGVYEHDGNEELLGKVSRITGIISLMVWLIVQTPQIIENYLLQTSGLSLYLLIFWICGDLVSFFAIFSRGLLYQKYHVAYCCLMDMILIFQYWYYYRTAPLKVQDMHDADNISRHRSRVNRRRTIRKNRFEQADEGSKPREPRLRNLHRLKGGSVLSKALETTLYGSIATNQAEALPIELEKKTNNMSQNLISQDNASSVGLISWKNFKYSAIQLGEIMAPAWLSSAFYLSSRPPQIIKNYRKQSTIGVSIYFFIFSIIGNVFYAASVISGLFVLFRYDNDVFNDSLMTGIPSLVYTIGTLIFDLIIIFQCYYYENLIEVTDTNLQGTEYLFGNHDDEEEQISREPIADQQVSSYEGGRSNPLNNIHEAATHFQTPDWYTNKHPASPDFYDKDDFENDRMERSNKKRNSRNFGRTSNEALSRRYLKNHILVSPPPHYISASDNLNKSYIQRGILSDAFQAIKNSVSRDSSLNATKYTGSESSHMLSSNTPLLNTSLIPSIIGNYSSVSRKLSNDPKAPFLPSDFLSDGFYHVNDSTSEDL